MRKCARPPNIPSASLPTTSLRALCVHSTRVDAQVTASLRNAPSMWRELNTATARHVDPEAAQPLAHSHSPSEHPASTHSEAYPPIRYSSTLVRTQAGSVCSLPPQTCHRSGREPTARAPLARPVGETCGNRSGTIRRLVANFAGHGG